MLTVFIQYPNGNVAYFTASHASYNKEKKEFIFLADGWSDPTLVTEGVARVQSGGTWYTYQLGEPTNG